MSETLQSAHERPEPIREQIGRRKLGNPAGFRFYSWEAIGSGRPEDRDVLMTGCVVTRHYSKGKNKGRPVYDGPPLKVVVTEAEEAAERARIEAEGRCGECQGEGTVFGGWHHITGTEYRECRRCRGTGKPPEQA